MVFSNRFLSATLGAAIIIVNAAASMAQTPTLAPDCDIWLRAAEACLTEIGQLTAAKQNALRVARDEMAALSGGSEDDGPRQRLNAQCRAMSDQLAEQREVRSRSCTI